MSRRFAPAMVFLAALAPAMAQAQVNIDQGKTPAQVFASDCATCHKSVRGLANGRGSSSLASFLAEHYTSSRDQAAALAAYVLGAGGTGGGGGRTTAPAAQTRGPKPGPERARGPTEEPPKPPTRQARRPTKPEEESPAPAKLQEPAGERSRPETEPIVAPEPGSVRSTRHQAAERHEKAAALPTRGRHKQIPQPAHEPATLVASPAAQATSPEESQTPAPAASAVTPGTTAGEASPVPRDNIPD